MPSCNTPDRHPATKSSTGPTHAARWPALPLALLAAALVLSGCGAVVVGGVALGAAAIHDRRPYHVVLDDQQIELAAAAAFLNDPLINAEANVSASSYNHSVLLTGRASSPDAAQRAVNMVSRLAKVKRVIDEIRIAPALGIKRQAEDGYLTTRAKLAIASIDLPGFDATRIKVVTDDGVIYLMGLVSPREADAAVEQVRYVPGAQRVVKLFEYISRVQSR